MKILKRIKNIERKGICVNYWPKNVLEALKETKYSIHTESKGKGISGTCLSQALGRILKIQYRHQEDKDSRSEECLPRKVTCNEWVYSIREVMRPLNTKDIWVELLNQLQLTFCHCVPWILDTEIQNLMFIILGLPFGFILTFHPSGYLVSEWIPCAIIFWGCRNIILYIILIHHKQQFGVLEQASYLSLFLILCSSVIWTHDLGIELYTLLLGILVFCLFVWNWVLVEQEADMIRVLLCLCFFFCLELPESSCGEWRLLIQVLEMG